MRVLGVVIESRLTDLVAKGVLASPRAVYDPGNVFDRIIIFTPYTGDLILVDQMLEYGIDVICHGGRPRWPWTLPIAVLRMAREIRHKGISVVRGSNAFLGSLMGAFAAWLEGVPSTLWMGGDNRISQSAENRWYYRSRSLTNLIEWATLRTVNSILVPNHFTERYVGSVAGECARKKVTVIPWAAARVPEQEPDEPDLTVNGITSSDILIPVLGFINRYKYSDVLFDALAEGPLQALDGPVRVVFCGDGELRIEGERRFSRRNDIKFIGFQQQPFVRALIRRSRVVCIPMSGMVMLETASLGRPVVSSTVEWHSEIIENDITGLLVEPTNPTAWRHALSRLLSDPVASARMAANLRARYEERYSVEVIAERTKDFYLKLSEDNQT